METQENIGAVKNGNQLRDMMGMALSDDVCCMDLKHAAQVNQHVEPKLSSPISSHCNYPLWFLFPGGSNEETNNYSQEPEGVVFSP